MTKEEIIDRLHSAQDFLARGFVADLSYGYVISLLGDIAKDVAKIEPTWEKVSEENYPENPALAVIRCEGYTGSYDNCPYGWNVLIRMGAEIIDLNR